MTEEFSGRHSPAKKRPSSPCGSTDHLLRVDDEDEFEDRGYEEDLDDEDENNSHSARHEEQEEPFKRRTRGLEFNYADDCRVSANEYELL